MRLLVFLDRFPRHCILTFGASSNKVLTFIYVAVQESSFLKGYPINYRSKSNISIIVNDLEYNSQANIASHINYVSLYL